MANFQNNAITDSGRALLSHVQMGAVFTPTKIVVGSGYMPPGKTARTMTDVVTPVKNLTINKKQRTNDGKAIFGGVYSNQDISQDWYFRELALYAKAVYPEGQEIAECLYSYGNAGDQADLMPAYTTGQPVERQMDLVVYVGNDAKVDLTIESGVYLTQEQAEKMIAEALADIDLDITDDTTGLKYRWGIQSGNAYLKESETEDKKLLVVMASQVGKPNGVAGLDGSGKVPAGQLPKMDYDPAGSAEAVQQALTAHTGNKNNPHAVTAEQVGASRAVKGTYPVAAGQSIQAGDVVDVVEGQVQKSAMPVENVETVFDNVATLGTSVLRLSDNLNVVCYLYQNGSTHWPCVHLVDDTGKVVGQTNRQVIENVHASNIMAARLSDTQFVVGYIENYTIKVNIGTANGSSITFGSSTVLESGGVTCISIVAISTNRVLITRNFGGSNEIRAGVYSVTGNKIENIGASIALPGITRADNISTTLLSNNSGGNNRVCVCFCDGADGSKGKAAIITVDSSNAVTWGNVVTFEGSQTLTPDVCVSGSDAIVFFRTTYTSSTVANQHVRLLKVSNNVISLPNEKKTIWNRGSGNAENPISISQVGEKYVCLIPPGNSTYRSPAIVVSRNADTLEPGETFQFSKSIAKALSACAISDNNLIVAYADAGNLNYGTVTTLTISGNQIAGSFVDGSQDAIALKSGTAGQSIEVIYSGTVAADWVTEGQVISSPGVYGAGVLDGVLQVWSKDRPDNVVTGTYIGDGAPSQTIQLGFTPKAVLVCQNGILSRGYQNHYAEGLALDGYPAAASNSNVVSVVEGGFQVFDGTSANHNGRTNVASQKYYYLTWE